MNYEVLINIHSIIPASRINGPGKRMVIFFQGCNNKCPGCFNPETHPFKIIAEYAPTSLLNKFFRPGIEGITVSGGDPFYTGFTYEQLENSTLCRTIFKYTDVLIDGRFEEANMEPTLLARGSTNQKLLFLSSRYNEGDFIMQGKAELIIGADGAVTHTGFSKVA